MAITGIEIIQPKWIDCHGKNNVFIYWSYTCRNTDRVYFISVIGSHNVKFWKQLKF